MPIVLISEALLLRATAIDGRLLRDRVLCGFCVRLNARKRSFRIATSVAGKQFRMTLGYWPLMSPCSLIKRLLGSPRLMLHDLRKLVATVGEKLGISDAVLRRILNHTAPKTDDLHQHYAGLSVGDIAVGLRQIQEALMGTTSDRRLFA